MTRLTGSSLDVVLTDALRTHAIAAPMPDGLLRVPDGWVRDRRWRPPGMDALVGAGVVVLAALGTLIVLTVFTALGQGGPTGRSGNVTLGVGVPIKGLDVVPRPGKATVAPATGPVIDVARGRVDGRAFRYTVYQAATPNDACIEFEWAPDSAQGCGSLPGEGPTHGAFGMVLSSDGSALVHGVFGLVATSATRVWIETSTGERARAELVSVKSTRIDARLFVAFLAGGVDATAWIALDATGNVIDRFEPAKRPAGAPGLMPAPAPTP